MRTMVAGAIGLLVAVLPAVASAQIKMSITGPGSQVFKVAVSPLKDLGGEDDGALSQSFNRTLSRDLELSGYFKIIDPHAYIEDPQKSGYQVGQINFADWTSINAEFLIKGSIGQNAGSTVIEAFLFDVAQQRQLSGKRYRGGRGEIDWMARRFADAILEAVTGQRGPFDSKIALVSTRGGRFKNIYTMAPDGKDWYRITNNPTINLFPSFDHKVEHLLYTSFKTGTPSLYLYDLTSGRDQAIRSHLGQIIGGALTSPGDAVVAAIEREGVTNLYVLDLEGNLIRPLTQGGAINVSPAVSADNSLVAFTSDRGGSPQIYVMGLQGGPARRLTYQGNYNTTPAFSPDGKKIAYQSRQGGQFEICVIDSGGGTPNRLTQGAGSCQQPTWSPDGRYIAFTSNSGGGARLYLIQVEGGKIISALTGEEEDGNATNPAWSWWLAD